MGDAGPTSGLELVTGGDGDETDEVGGAGPRALVAPVSEAVCSSTSSSPSAGPGSVDRSVECVVPRAIVRPMWSTAVAKLSGNVGPSSATSGRT